ncbi:MAG: hypothetical protein WCQ64_17280 [Acidobacteriota bacterium]
MNAPRLVRHVMCVDFRAQRWMLAAWGGILLAQAWLFAAGPDRFGSAPSRIDYDFGIAVVRFGWTGVLAALLVQSDSLVGGVRVHASSGSLSVHAPHAEHQGRWSNSRQRRVKRWHRC